MKNLTKANKSRLELNNLEFTRRLYQKYSNLPTSVFIKYLRACLFAVYTYLGEPIEPPTKTFAIDVALSGGLPKVLPPFFRRQIRLRNVAIIHLVVSVFNSYKAIADEYHLDLESGSTIMAAPHSGEEYEIQKTKFFNYIYNNSPLLESHFDITCFNENQRFPQPSVASGPSGSMAGTRYEEDWEALVRHGKWQTLLDYGKATKFEGLLEAAQFNYPNSVELDLEWPIPCKDPDPGLWYSTRMSSQAFEQEVHKQAEAIVRQELDVEQDPDLLESLEKMAKENRYRPRDLRFKQVCSQLLEEVKKTQIGKLAVKLEGAGKVRVFAMLDSWTQWAFRPLHDMIFAYLKTIPSDATFDQDKACLDFVQANLGKRFFSYDLSAATDMIPKELYEGPLSYILNPTAANLWCDLLSRPFLAPEKFWTSKESPFWLRYTRGQPMGCYSSWACLALLQHLMVAYCHYTITGRSNEFPVGSYLVLGDDIVFSDKALAEKYCSLCKTFGISINLAKSFPNSTIFNFANQTFMNDGTNISAISLKEVLRATTFARKSELINRLLRRGYIEKGLSNLFRSFYSPESWLRETRFLSLGTYSPFGKRVLRALLHPTGSNVESPITAIKAYYPNNSLLSHPNSKKRESHLKYMIDNHVLLDNPARNPLLEYSKPIEIRLLGSILRSMNKKLDQYLEDLSKQITLMTNRIGIALSEDHLGVTPISDSFLYDFAADFIDKKVSKLPYVWPRWGAFESLRFKPTLWGPYYAATLNRYINRLRDIRKELLNAGYTEDGFSYSKYSLDIIRISSLIEPIFNIISWKAWTDLAKIAQRKKENYVEFDSTFSRHLIASARCLELITSSLLFSPPPRCKKKSKTKRKKQLSLPRNR